jgi:hypothetical protein
MKLVILESPYAAPDPADIQKNVEYARACVKDCLHRGEAPIASHLLFTQPGILDDTIPEERTLGMSAGFAWREAADATVVYLDRGTSKGMERGIAHSLSHSVRCEFRYLYPVKAEDLQIYAGETLPKKDGSPICPTCFRFVTDHLFSVHVEKHTGLRLYRACNGDLIKYDG